MIKNIVLQNKQEKDDFYKEIYTKRNLLPSALSDIDSSLIKLIIGPRRAGKSVFSFMLLKSKEFAYLNFDDENLIKINDLDSIIEAFHEVYGNFDYIFFDEIQNLNNWELFVNKLKRRKYKLIITGSNANMLSQDIATVLTGRYISYKILPFGFNEFLRFKKIKVASDSFSLPKKRGKILRLAESYLTNGGYPELLKEKINAQNYLTTLFDATLFKDVVTRHQIRHPVKLKELAYYLTANFTSLFTYNSLKKNLNFSSVETLEKYVYFLENSYLFFTLNKFSFKYKQQNNSAKKIYLIDNGFVKAKTYRFSKDYGKLLENAVFIELLRRGYLNNESLFYYSTKSGKEIDFIVKNITSITGIYQVAYSIENIETEEREISALIVAANELNCKTLNLITWNTEKTIKKNGLTITVIPFYKWTLI